MEFGAGHADASGPRRDRGYVQHDDPVDLPRHGSFARHPIHATAEEAADLLQVAAEGRSPATPAILIGAVLTFVVPLAAIIMVLAFGIAHLS
jgi:hypothetical protein